MNWLFDQVQVENIIKSMKQQSDGFIISEKSQPLDKMFPFEKVSFFEDMGCLDSGRTSSSAQNQPPIEALPQQVKQQQSAPLWKKIPRESNKVDCVSSPLDLNNQFQSMSEIPFKNPMVKRYSMTKSDQFSVNKKNLETNNNQIHQTFTKQRSSSDIEVIDVLQKIHFDSEDPELQQSKALSGAKLNVTQSDHKGEVSYIIGKKNEISVMYDNERQILVQQSQPRLLPNEYQLNMSQPVSTKPDISFHINRHNWQKIPPLRPQNQAPHLSTQKPPATPNPQLQHHPQSHPQKTHNQQYYNQLYEIHQNDMVSPYFNCELYDGGDEQQAEQRRKGSNNDSVNESRSQSRNEKRKKEVKISRYDEFMNKVVPLGHNQLQQLVNQNNILSNKLISYSPTPSFNPSRPQSLLTKGPLEPLLEVNSHQATPIQSRNVQSNPSDPTKESRASMSIKPRPAIESIDLSPNNCELQKFKARIDSQVFQRKSTQNDMLKEINRLGFEVDFIDKSFMSEYAKEEEDEQQMNQLITNEINEINNEINSNQTPELYNNSPLNELNSNPTQIQPNNDIPDLQINSTPESRRQMQKPFESMQPIETVNDMSTIQNKREYVLGTMSNPSDLNIKSQQLPSPQSNRASGHIIEPSQKSPQKQSSSKKIILPTTQSHQVISEQQSDVEEKLFPQVQQCFREIKRNISRTDAKTSSQANSSHPLPSLKEKSQPETVKKQKKEAKRNLQIINSVNNTIIMPVNSSTVQGQQKATVETREQKVPLVNEDRGRYGSTKEIIIIAYKPQVYESRSSRENRKMRQFLIEEHQANEVILPQQIKSGARNEQASKTLETRQTSPTFDQSTQTIQTLKRQLSQSQQNCQQLNLQLSQYQQKITALQQQNISLKQAKFQIEQSYITKLKDLENQYLTKITEQSQSLEASVKELKLEICHLEEEKGRLTDELVQISRQLAEFKNIQIPRRDQLIKLQEENQQLHTQLSQLHEKIILLEDQHKLYLTKYSEVIQQFEASKRQETNRQNALNHIRQETKSLEDEITLLQQKLQQKQAMVQKLQIQRNDMYIEMRRQKDRVKQLQISAEHQWQQYSLKQRAMENQIKVLRYQLNQLISKKQQNHYPYINHLTDNIKTTHQQQKLQQTIKQNLLKRTLPPETLHTKLNKYRHNSYLSPQQQTGLTKALNKKNEEALMLSPKVERIKNRYGRQVEVSKGKEGHERSKSGRNSVERSKRLIKEIRKDIRVIQGEAGGYGNRDVGYRSERALEYGGSVSPIVDNAIYAKNIAMDNVNSKLEKLRAEVRKELATK